MDRPLITYVVASFNQERFIREAVVSAFAQTYSPLEIILTDDNSGDRTFEIMREMAAAYQGPHTIRLNRNAANLGIGGHVNRIMELCHGELVVATAGDDVSLPMRVETIYQAWEASGRRATSIFSSYTIMSQEGQVEGLGGLRGDAREATPVRRLEGSLFEFLSAKMPVVNGCTHAWSPALFNFFGPVQSDLEDLVLSFRTLAIGTLLYIHQPLVKYRRHGGNVSFLAERDDTMSFEHREKRLRWVDEKHVSAYDNMLADIEVLRRGGRLDNAECARLSAEACRVRARYAVEREMMDSSLIRRWRTLLKTIRSGNFRCAIRSLPRGLPQPLYRALYLLRNRWRSVVRGNN